MGSKWNKEARKMEVEVEMKKFRKTIRLLIACIVGLTIIQIIQALLIHQILFG